MRFATIGAVSLGMIVSGCAEKDSIFHDRAVKPGTEPHVITVDAKQRSVLFVPVKSPESETSSQVTTNNFVEGTSSDGQKGPVPRQTVTASRTKVGEALNWRLCAEAAPDVFSALATSASGEASTDGKTSFGAKFGLSSAETAATIGRTQAINMLRESMYRTCERYLSGAISKTIFVTQAARDQRSMIAFLAIEQLTGAVKPPATIISGPATSSALGAGAEAVKLVADFRKSAIDAATAQSKAQTDYDAALKKADCEKNDKPAEDADDQAIADFKACLDAKSTLADKKSANEKAQTQLDQALKMGAATGTLAEAATQAGQTNPGGGAAASAVSEHLAQAVTSIVTASNINEALMFCIGYFSDTASARNDALSDGCRQVLVNSASADAEATKKLSFLPDSAGSKILDKIPLDNPQPSIARVKEALKALGQKPSPANVIRVTTNQDPALSAAVLAYINAKYP
ncbi:hypothetical protein [Novosphingobium jiangmenense]|uniref:Uncharacterized protein n=1 Tax=Novosphingobium jiangmenense TaxID=2791981 RepID=A0ABS0HJS8_9SPHN|nr:hypothetical protein [Novosphingobium jiangmenense]MBF9152516.1 hypothetical protein [Novosphingobium jiangmenense]